MLKECEILKIKDKLIDKSWKKILIIFIIVFFIIFLSGVIVVNNMETTIKKGNIHSELLLIEDKTHGEGALSGYYIIVGNNKTYTMLDDGRINTQQMYDNIKMGSKYRVIVQEGPFDDASQYTHILQVDNVTS